jgi:hypothetical protein
MKYHHLERCFTYRMKRPMVSVVSGLRAVKVWDYGWLRHFHGRRRAAACRLARPVRVKPPREDPTVLTTAPIAPHPLARAAVRESCFETSARWGVWLGRHICYTTTQVS